jgi:hypothetical protein
VPTPLPLATGTLANCSAYAEYISPQRNTSTINTCYVVATFYDGMERNNPSQATENERAEIK